MRSDCPSIKKSLSTSGKSNSWLTRWLESFPVHAGQKVEKHEGVDDDDDGGGGDDDDDDDDDDDEDEDME